MGLGPLNKSFTHDPATYVILCLMMFNGIFQGHVSRPMVMALCGILNNHTELLGRV
jgi:hypothetical protein